VDDGATVPVWFEPRSVELALDKGVTQQDLDRAADAITTGVDDVERSQIEKSTTVINAVYGDPKRLALLAEDFVAHWKTRSTTMRPLIEEPGCVQLR
jgi:type I restriction enzyme, R subunit